MRLSAIQSPVTIIQRLREDGSAATLNRLGTSQHVADLRLMFSATLYVFVIGSLFAIGFGYWHTISDAWQKEVSQPHHAWLWVRLFGDSIVTVSPFIGAVFALGSAIVGWGYQAGSARLGIVDLFACEISTLCRVCTITDLTRRYVQAFYADLGADKVGDPAMIDRVRRAFSHFDASENYTPVFDHNAADLRVLDVKVVTNVTAFYTYFKAMKDTRRELTKIDPPTAVGDPHDAWHEALKNVLYMQFLAFESARKAVRDLIEFDPNQVENTITILISELCAYRFLMQQFGPAQDGTIGEDFRHVRLKLRYKSYREIVGRAYFSAIEGEQYWIKRANDARDAMLPPPSQAELEHGSKTVRLRRRSAAIAIDRARQWRKSAESANELKSRYKLVFPGEEIERPVDLPAPNPGSATSGYE